MALEETDYKKLLDLCRVYGKTGVGDIICVDNDVVELALLNVDFKPELAKGLRSGIRKYWKTWMGKHREK